jgi:mono/diheme cytochrome c family protein
MKAIKYVVFSLSMLAAAAGILIYSGLYPMGADVPHTKLSYWALETLRDRSIERSSKDIEVPDLSAPEQLIAGGADYEAMCSSCHLKPGEKDSDMSIGLYPAPPNLTIPRYLHRQNTAENRIVRDAQRQFWIIKHGIKASGMPAWGPTHDDRRIWAIVAFLQKLPDLNGAQYQILTARGDRENGHQ